ncbi:hypothetical protein ACT4S2_04900 [Kocuria turfanensis]|uniref:Uncharacterized protein n=1 Tax=Kocuria turfanensis TaxID=388357 RepID=A0A512IFY2_9MICC|nr:hypothetical protein [Kocuria turfanensis]GEO96567.1 hypothetical protein KTU01_26900 [Kocuria turfanensis]
MADPVDPITVAAARARLAADAHRGVESEAWIAGIAESGGPHRPGAPRTSAADVLSGRDDAHTVSSDSDRRSVEWTRDLADRGG